MARDVLMQGRVAHLPFFLLFHHLLLSPSTNNSRRSRLRVHQTEEVGKFIPGKAARVECTPSRAALCCCFCCCCFYLSLLFPSALRPSFPAIDSIPARCYDRREVRSPAQVKAHGNDTAASSKPTTFYISFFHFSSSPFLLLFSRPFGFLFFFILSMRLSAIDEVTGLVADTTTHFPFLCGTSVPCAAPPPNSVNGSTHVCVCVLEKWKAIKNKDGDGARSASCVCSRAVFWTQPAVETFSRFCACGWLTLDVTIAPSASIAMQPSFTSSTPFMLILAWLFPDQTRWAVTSFPSSVLYNPLAPPDGEINQKRTLLSVYFRSKPCALNSVARRRRQKGPKEFEGFFYTKRKRKVWLLSITTRSASASLLYLSVPTIIT